MKKIISLFILAFLVGINYGAFAQGNITIGTGSSGSHLSPMNRGKNYSTHEIIYLQSELGGPNLLTKMAFYKKEGVNVEGIEEVVIYMKHTTESTLEDGNYSLNNDYIKVFDGTFTNNEESGWMEVTLINGGFSYNGDNNLQILILKGYQSSISKKPVWRYTNLNEYRTRNESDNNSQPTYLKNDKKRPNIRLEYDAPLYLWVEIGTGTEAHEKSPINRKYNYSTTEIIYTQSEIGSGYLLTGLAFYKKEGTNVEGIENVTIYMKNTTESSFTDGVYSLEYYTEVYSGTFTNNASNAWMEVIFENGFSYNGSGNLQILIIKGYQSKTSHEPQWSYTEISENRTRDASDNTLQPTMLEANNKLPNIRLIYDHPNPVELTSFISTVKDRNVNLNWSTAGELNNAGFEIERRTIIDGAGWIKIGFVQGNGTTNEPKNYSFEDKKLETGKYNYRLKQLDYNNKATLFDLNNAIEIGIPRKFELSQNYPNPFNPITKIDYNLPFNGNVSLKIYDISGREITSLVNKTQEAGYYTVQFNASNFASGTYFYRISANSGQENFVMTKRMLFIK